jgi:hypothetical protein
MEDIISLTYKQLRGLVYHLNEELYLQQVHGNNDRRIVTEHTLATCINFYNNPDIASSFEEQDKEQRELELDKNIVKPYLETDRISEGTQHSPTRKQIAERLVDGLKWSDKDYGKAFKIT